MKLRAGICFTVIILGITSILSSQGVQNRVVGNGTPASCTEAALDTALVAGGLITFNCGGAVTIPLTSTKAITTKDVTLDGGGLITFTGSGETRLFRVSVGRTLKLLNLALEEGFSNQNGGALLNNGAVEIRNSMIANNNADSNGGAIINAGKLTLIKTYFKENVSGANGGAIFNDTGGVVNIIGSAFEGNFSAWDGGAIFVNGNVSLNSLVNVANSTFFGNTADNGGAIYAFGANATVNITHVTFSQNSGFGSASTLGKDSPAFILVRNSILTAPGAASHCSLGIIEQGGNVVHGASCEGIANPVSTADPLLGTPEGSPPYFPLNAGSPAINVAETCTYLSAGENPLFSHGAAVEIDQRWFARPANNICDAGAYEAGAVPAVLTITPTPSNTPTFTNTLPITDMPETETPVGTETLTETPMETLPHTQTPTASVTLDPSVTAVTNTPSVTASLTETPDGEITSTPQITPASTETPGGSVTLSINGSFEVDADDDKLPDGWTLKYGDSAKRKCNKDKIIAFDGDCVFQFKGSGKLRQNIDPVNLEVGDTLTFSGYYAAKGSLINAKAKVTVKYPAAPKGKITFNITAPTVDYIPFTGELSLTLAEQPAGIRIQLQSASGRIRFDALTLTLMSGTSGLMPLP